MSLYYVLKDRVAVEADMRTWATFFEDRSNRRVASTYVDHVWISTVFLGIDHGFPENPLAPLIFETMVFNAPTDFAEEYCERYGTWNEAVAGHQGVLREVTKAIKR